MNNWNGLDFFIFLILVLNTVVGMRRGATKEIVSLMCLSAALIFTIKFTVPLSNFFAKSPIVNDFVQSPFTQNFMQAIGAGPMTLELVNQIMYSISMLICFVGVFSICDGALSLSGFNEYFSFPYAMLNRKVGGSLGFLRGYVISLILIVILGLHLYKGGGIGGEFLSGSFFANLFGSQAQDLDGLISSQKPENYQKIYENKPYNEKDLYKNFPNQNFFGSQTIVGSGVTVTPTPTAPTAPTPAP